MLNRPMINVEYQNIFTQVQVRPKTPEVGPDLPPGDDPRTGEAVEVEEKHVPFFKTGKYLRDRLNGN